LRDIPAKGDVSDWLDTGGTVGGLDFIVDATDEWSEPSEPWESITPFNSGPLPEFPVNALPSVLRNWVAAESHATQTPPELAALLALAVCAAGIARRVVVDLGSGWREPVNLFVAV